MSPISSQNRSYRGTSFAFVPRIPTPHSQCWSPEMTNLIQIISLIVLVLIIASDDEFNVQRIHRVEASDSGHESGSNRSTLTIPDDSKSKKRKRSRDDSNDSSGSSSDSRTS